MCAMPRPRRRARHAGRLCKEGSWCGISGRDFWSVEGWRAIPNGLNRGDVQSLAGALAHPCQKKQIENGDALRRNDQQVCLELREDD